MWPNRGLFLVQRRPLPLKKRQEIPSGQDGRILALRRQDLLNLQSIDIKNNRTFFKCIFKFNQKKMPKYFQEWSTFRQHLREQPRTHTFLGLRQAFLPQATQPAIKRFFFRCGFGRLSRFLRKKTPDRRQGIPSKST